MQDTYSRMLITTGSSRSEPQSSFDDYVKNERSRIKARQAATIRKRLSALMSCVSVTLALAALLFTGLEATDRLIFNGGALEFVIDDVFGIGSEYEAANFTELMMEQSFWGNVSKISLPGGNNSDANSLQYPLPSINKPSAPQKEDDKPVNTIPQNPVDIDDTINSLEELYKFDQTLVPSGHLAIVPKDMSRESDGVLKLSNETKYTPDLAAMANSMNTVEAFSSSGTVTGEPLVLIIHTHGTEAYSEEGSLSYNDTYNIPRSNDKTKNVVAVGTIMSEVLNSAGIPTIHCEIMHDLESYRDSYSRAAETIKSYLEKYPSIKYVFDVHRDSILLADQSKVRPVTLVNSHSTAQIMLVVGTDYFGANHPNWMKNLTFAVRIQTALNANYKGFARSINLRGAAFNEQYTPGSLLLEVGSCGNTLKEAMRAGETLAQTLASIIKSGW